MQKTARPPCSVCPRMLRFMGESTRNPIASTKAGAEVSDRPQRNAMTSRDRETVAGLTHPRMAVALPRGLYGRYGWEVIGEGQALESYIQEG